MVMTMTVLASRTSQKIRPLNFLRRKEKGGERAGKNGFEPYDNFIWALASKFTASTEEAEAATKEIFIDIWQYANRTDSVRSAEDHLIELIARRRLIKRLE